MENLGFVNDIKSLILQLGCIPGALFSVDSLERARVSGFPGRDLTDDLVEVGQITHSNNLMGDSSKQLSNSSDHSRLITGQSDYVATKVQENSLMISSSILSPYYPLEKEVFSPISRVERGAMRAEVICHNPDEKLNQFISSCSAYYGVNFQAAQDQISVQHCSETTGKQMSLVLRAQNLVNSETRDLPSVITSQSRVLDSSKSLDTSQVLEGDKLLNKFKNHSGPVDPLHSFSSAPEPSLTSLTDVGFQNSSMTELEGIPLFNLSEQLLAYTTEVLSGGSDQINNPVGMNNPRIASFCKNQRMGNDSATVPNLPLTHLNDNKPLLDNGFHSTVSSNLSYEDALQQSGGDNLFDIFGVDMKNKIFSGKFGSVNSHKLSSESLISRNIQEAHQDLNLVDNSSMTGNDHLLDAVVSGVHSALKQNSDESLSCRSTMTRISNFSLPSHSLPHCQSNTMGKVQEDSLGILEPPLKEGTLGSGSLKSGCTKNEATCSESNSLCSQVKLSADQGHAMKRDNSILTTHSRGPDEAAKPCHKKLRSGESPKPRPKDRQMIQDRLKELRDIVPNGGKVIPFHLCSVPFFFPYKILPCKC